MMDRYLLFVFDQYYPQGGFNDLQGSYETEEEVLEAWENSSRDYGQIVDLETREVRDYSHFRY